MLRQGGDEDPRAKEGDKSDSPAAQSPGSWNVQRGRSRVRRPSGSSGDNPFSEENLKKRGYHSLYSSFGKVFHVEKRWKLIREMGSGAYGVVISAADSLSGETVAIKLVTRVFEKIQLAKRALREITLLRHFAHHENITGLIDVDAIHPTFNEIYIFMEPMEADLHQIIKSGQNLTNEHVQYFVYQVLRGMKYVHSASVIHRDLKPGNLLVNADCELKICDFGLSRGYESRPDEAPTHLTEYVATRWYRAPEIMLAFRRYNTAIDVWSIGCILAELLLGKPLFKGKDYVDQLNKILDVLGTPDEKVIKRIGSDKAQAYVRSLPYKKTIPLRKVLPTADVLALDLLGKMLSFDPGARITVQEALCHPWLASYHDETDEPDCPSPFTRWQEIEKLETIEDFREALWNEIEAYRREVRGLDATVPEAEEPMIVDVPPHVPPKDEPPTELPPEAPLVEEPDLIQDVVASPEDVPMTSPAVERILKGEEPKRRDSLAVPEPPTHHRRVMSTPADPMVSYSRRSSILQPNRHSVAYNSSHPAPRYTDSPKPEDAKDTVAFPSQGYVLPARSRTGSVAGIEPSRRLLRTLSTVSIHESGAGLAGGLADLAPIGKIILDGTRPTAADAPASEMPKDFEMQEDGTEGSDEEPLRMADKDKALPQPTPFN
ncbi:kinase-like protein [Flagelloscypha sp. PMI_526]|nr:kinase-like protein [Flagelloscypha sp. PMI_526]